MKKKLLVCVAALGLLAGGIRAEAPRPKKPSKKDRCLVCGMFVATYRHWIAVVSIDEDRQYFDGCKCMFRYLQDPEKFKKKQDPLVKPVIHVTDYYSTKLIDGRKAFYVIGSDVLGPMGNELVPFVTEKDALEFKKDHKGKSILTFEKVTPDVIKNLMFKP